MSIDARPVWFLDVDGVLSPVAVPDSSDPSVGPVAFLYPGDVPSPARVPYRTRAVQRISDLAAEGLVEVRWLTTWESDLVTEWRSVGLGPFEHEARIEARGWWKRQVVRNHLAEHPGRPVVWTDDQIGAAHVRNLPRGGLLLPVSPRADIGLTDRHLNRIETWLRERATDTAGRTSA